jgi:hypothetical protein
MRKGVKDVYIQIIQYKNNKNIKTKKTVLDNYYFTFF